MEVTFGQRLKELRKEKSVYQTDLAEYLSVTTRQIINYEKDKVDPPLSTAVALADYFNVPLDYLVGRSNEKELRFTQKNNNS